MSKDDQCSGGVDTSIEPATISNFRKNFTWEKLHAVGYGAGLAALASAIQSPELLAAWFAIFFWALGIRASPSRRTASGDPKPRESGEDRSGDGAGDDTSETPRGRRGLPAAILEEIRHKPHYFGIGGAVGDRLAMVYLTTFQSIEPSHYGEAVGMIRSLLVGL